MNIDGKQYLPRSGADAAQLDPKHPDHNPDITVVDDDVYAAMERGEKITVGDIKGNSTAKK